jgi:hypothetical protein
MYFPVGSDINGILAFITPKLKAVLNSAKYGVDVDIKNHIKNRTLEQNKYLYAIYKHIVEFHQEHDTFMIDNLPLKFISSDFLHAYFKARFDVKTTTKMSTIEFTEYTDKIQLLMINQTNGIYDPIYPEDRYQTF